MATSTVYSSIPAIECFYLDAFTDGYGARDDGYVTYWQAYDPITNRAVGPWHGDPNPAYIRLWMAET